MVSCPLSRRSVAGATALVASLAAVGAVATAAGGPTLSTLPGSYDEPRGVAFAPDGSYLVADTKHHRVLRLAGGGVQIVAGTGAGDFHGDGGLAVNAELKEPTGVAALPGGGFLIADTENDRIRRVSSAGRISTEVGGGDDDDDDDGDDGGGDVEEPTGIVATSATDFVFADTGNDRVREVVNGQIRTLSGSLRKPSAVAVRPSDGAIIVADTGNDRVVVLKNRTTTTLPGGTGLNEPKGIAVRADGGVLVTESKGNRVVEIRDGQRAVLAGTGDSGAGPDGPAAGARLDKPEGLALDAGGRVLLANTHADRVYLVANVPETTPAPVAPGAAPGPAAKGPGGSPAKKDADGAGADGVAATLDPAAAPKLGKSVTTGLARGTVRVRPAGADDYVDLVDAASVPLGSVVDTTNGAVRLTSAANATGATQTATFSRGAFKLGQTGGKRPITDLTLTGPLPACAAAKKGTARASKAPAKRRLWGDGKGRFRTKGRYSSATVRGTRWLTEDRCGGTVVKVVHGVVGVRDLTRRRTVTVKGGEQYLAKPPTARRRATR